MAASPPPPERNSAGQTYEEWEEASWATIDAMELVLGDDALAIQRKAKAKRRRERKIGQGGTGGAAGASGWLAASADNPAPAARDWESWRGEAVRAPVTFGLAKKKKPPKRVPTVGAARSEWFGEGVAEAAAAAAAKAAAGKTASDICSDVPTVGTVSEDSTDESDQGGSEAGREPQRSGGRR